MAEYNVGDRVRFETHTKIPHSNRKDDWEAGHTISQSTHRGVVVEKDGNTVFVTDQGDIFPDYLANNVSVICSFDEKS